MDEFLVVASLEFFSHAMNLQQGDSEMAILDRNIERHAEAGHTILHPAADRGFVNGSDAVRRRFSSGDESISPQFFPARHLETERHRRPEGKQDEQAPQTIEEFWNEQDDGWW